MAERVVLAVTAELTYLLLTRLLLPGLLDQVELELVTTTLRLATALLYWLLFRQLISNRQPRPYAAGGLLVLGSALLILLAAWLVADQHYPDMTVRLLFASTSIAVAVREEILYRGVLQNALESQVGVPLAVVTSNLIFVAYHWGALPLNAASMVEIFSVGCILGIIYVATGSLWKVIALHTIYDAIFVMSPMQAPLNKWVGNATILIALMLAVTWLFTKSRNGDRPLIP